VSDSGPHCCEAGVTSGKHCFDGMKCVQCRRAETGRDTCGVHVDIWPRLRRRRLVCWRGEAVRAIAEGHRSKFHVPSFRMSAALPPLVRHATGRRAGAGRRAQTCMAPRRSRVS